MQAWKPVGKRNGVYSAKETRQKHGRLKTEQAGSRNPQNTPFLEDGAQIMRFRHSPNNLPDCLFGYIISIYLVDVE